MVDNNVHGGIIKNINLTSLCGRNEYKNMKIKHIANNEIDSQSINNENNLQNGIFLSYSKSFSSLHSMDGFGLNRKQIRLYNS